MDVLRDQIVISESRPYLATRAVEPGFQLVTRYKDEHHSKAFLMIRKVASECTNLGGDIVLRNYDVTLPTSFAEFTPCGVEMSL